LRNPLIIHLVLSLAAISLFAEAAYGRSPSPPTLSPGFVKRSPRGTFESAGGLLPVPLLSAGPELRLLPGEALPLAQEVWKGGTADDLLCYHAGAAYYIKVPHPAWGNPGPFFQRITPGGSGTLSGCQLRLYNEYTDDCSHDGELMITVHRRVEGFPGEAVGEFTVATDSLGNDIFDWEFNAFDFHFVAGEEFFLGVDFQPFAEEDTIAMVTADLGDWTGHSFFLIDGQTVWWGDPQGTPFGDMHFCALVDYPEGSHPYIYFPWDYLDLGLVETGQLLESRLPILNWGIEPLVAGEPEITGEGWSVELSGPDSLLHPDTLFLEVVWSAPDVESLSDAELTLATNAVNDSLLELDLHAGSSRAELLLNDWDEWELLSFTQFADTGAGTENWAFYSGLSRVGYFVGHGSPEPGFFVEDVLAVRDLPLEERGYVEIRWAQQNLMLENLGFHALIWRNPEDAWWYVQHGVDLLEPPYLGNEDSWSTVPWILWGPVPSTGEHAFGLLYSGSEADQWFVDDLEFVMHVPLEPPQISIQRVGSGVRLTWNSVEDAEWYRLEYESDGAFRTLAAIPDTSWNHQRAMVYHRSLRYRVMAASSLDIDSAIGPDDGRALFHDSQLRRREDR